MRFFEIAARCERGGYLLSYRVVFCIQSKLGLKA